MPKDPESSDSDLPMGTRARSEFDASDHTLRDRVTRIEAKLDNGQSEFSGLRQEIRRVERSIDEVRVKPMSRGALASFILGPVIAFAVMFGTYVWQLAKYPDRAEYDAALREMGAERAALRDRIYKLEQEITRLDAAINQHQRDLNRIEATASAKEKKR